MVKIYWFKRKRYGWGWVPVTWQGWLLVIGYIVSITSAIYLPVIYGTRCLRPRLYFEVPFIIATGVLLYTTYKKGPKPKWRWGKKPDDDPELDW